MIDQSVIEKYMKDNKFETWELLKVKHNGYPVIQFGFKPDEHGRYPIVGYPAFCLVKENQLERIYDIDEIFEIMDENREFEEEE